MPSAAPEPLSVEDARILALEEGPVRGHTCKLVLLDGVRATDALREHVGSRLDREHRLGVRLVEGDVPVWEPDPALEIERQVRDAGAVDAAGLADAVGALMAERLPRDRPLWALDVIAIEGGRTALVWRIHHALADGSTAMRMARNVLFDEAGAAGAAAPARETAPSRAAPLARASPRCARPCTSRPPCIASLPAAAPRPPSTPRSASAGRSPSSTSSSTRSSGSPTPCPSARPSTTSS